MKNNLKRILISILFLLIILNSLTGCTKETSNVQTSIAQLTKEEKLEDFEYLYKIIGENYPFLKVNERVNGIDWLENKDEYKDWIESTTNNENFMGQISNIVKELNNGHTHVVSKEEFKWYYDVYANSESSKTYNKPWAKVFKNDKVLEWYDFDENQIKEFENGKYFGSNDPAFDSDIIIPNEVAYLKINRMNGKRVEEDGKEIREFYEEIKDYDKLIIDIRGNGGGSDLYWQKNVIEPLAKVNISVDNYIFTRGSYGETFYKSRGMKLSPISKLDKKILEDFPEEIETDFDYYNIFTRTLKPVYPVDFKGKIYLLVDQGVYSSSESFAAFCKDSGFATLVGETTGGDGIGTDPLFFSLPNSGIVIRFSSLLALNGDGTINEEVQTIPNVEIDATTGANYEEDKAIQYVINN